MTDAAVELPRQAVEFTYSVVIPVFNSEELVGGVSMSAGRHLRAARARLARLCRNPADEKHPPRRRARVEAPAPEVQPP